MAPPFPIFLGKDFFADSLDVFLRKERDIAPGKADGLKAVLPDATPHGRDGTLPHVRDFLLHELNRDSLYARVMIVDRHRSGFDKNEHGWNKGNHFTSAFRMENKAPEMLDAANFARVNDEQNAVWVNASPTSTALSRLVVDGYEFDFDHSASSLGSEIENPPIRLPRPEAVNSSRTFLMAIHVSLFRFVRPHWRALISTVTTLKGASIRSFSSGVAM
jgi:hypothetical protein